jgi:ATP-dependent Clp protease ATP-binding subunit ClpX
MAKEKLECSFCGRKKPDTSLLIAGIDAHMINVLSRHMELF